jgi:hypothetical protein
VLGIPRSRLPAPQALQGARHRQPAVRARRQPGRGEGDGRRRNQDNDGPTGVAVEGAAVPKPLRSAALGVRFSQPTADRQRGGAANSWHPGAGLYRKSAERPEHEGLLICGAITPAAVTSCPSVPPDSRHGMDRLR